MEKCLILLLNFLQLWINHLKERGEIKRCTNPERMWRFERSLSEERTMVDSWGRFKMIKLPHCSYCSLYNYLLTNNSFRFAKKKKKFPSSKELNDLDEEEWTYCAIPFYQKNDRSFKLRRNPRSFFCILRLVGRIIFS